MVTKIIKRDGRTAEFNESKITDAVEKAFQASGAMQDRATAQHIADKVVAKLEAGAIEGTPTVEGIQDLVEETLIEEGFTQTAKAYILYRAERSRIRDVNSRLIQTLKDITFSKAADSDMKRENANIDADTAMGTMLKYGSESAKQFYTMCVIDPKYARAHMEGDIHIHDMDFYTLTTTCCQIDLRKLFKGGFSTGHGVLREPNDISSYAALACIAVQSNQNDQHGGQSICDFDYGLAEGVRKTYRRLYKKHLAEALDLLAEVEDAKGTAQDVMAQVEEATGQWAHLAMDEAFLAEVRTRLAAAGIDEGIVGRVMAYAAKNAEADTDRATFQAMEALIHNLNNIDADIVFVKNIDNVITEERVAPTVQYKKALAAHLIQLQARAFQFLRLLERGEVDDMMLCEIMDFAESELVVSLGDEVNRDVLFDKLNRPIRVCGMVKNEGEPGGGPFWVTDGDGVTSLQIVESSQIDKNDPAQIDIMAHATHFNPVDMVCALKNYKGEQFNLLNYVDPETGFISSKSYGDRTLRALELPGLWNGAMSRWNTIFVEVPIETFNPVKTVFDLLRR